MGVGDFRLDETPMREFGRGAASNARPTRGHFRSEVFDSIVLNVTAHIDQKKVGSQRGLLLVSFGSLRYFPDGLWHSTPRCWKSVLSPFLSNVGFSRQAMLNSLSAFSEIRNR